MAADDRIVNKDYIFGGYEFMTEDDAKKASMDLSKINLLEARVKASRPNDIHAVYEKAIENKIFKTPIGWNYLSDLRKKLISSGFMDEDLTPIPIEISLTRHSALENLNVRQRIKPEAREKAEFKKVFPLVLNVVLVILVILMFVIAYNGETDNIINYKKNVTNRYSEWDESLKEREKAVREAEKKLGIESAEGYYENADTQ